MYIKPSATRIVTILVATIMILAGLYTLAVVLTPAIIAPTINPTSNNAITFYVKQGTERKKIIIRPTIRTGIIIELK